MSKPYTATSRMMHEWGIGGLAYYEMTGMIFSLSAVFTMSYQMDPGWVALAMTLPRLIDLVIDPLIGRLSDNLHSRWGRRRPFIFMSAILGAVTIVGVWWMPLDWVEKPLWSFTLYQPVLNWGDPSLSWGWVSHVLSWGWAPHVMPWSFVYLLTFTTLLFAALGVFEMSHTALGYELSDDYDLRSKVQMVRNFYFCIGCIGGGYTYWLAQRSWFGTGHLGEVNGFRLLSILMGVVVLVTGIIPAVLCRERFAKINRTHVRIWPALKATLKNRAFVNLLVQRLIGIVGTTLWGAMAFYIAVYSVFSGDLEFYNFLISGSYGIAACVVSLAMIPLVAPLTKRLGKRNGMIISNGLWLISALLTPFFMVPGRPYLWFFFGLFFLPSWVIGGNFSAAVMPDICDLDELAHGERREGLFTAVTSFMSKLEYSVCLALSGWLLVAAGYDQHLTQQPQAVLDKMRLYGFIPMIGGSILTFIVACFFPLNQKMMESVRAQLDARHAALAIDAEPAASGKVN